MMKLGSKINPIPCLQRFNAFKWSPLVWWSLLSAILPYLFSLFKVPITWRVGLLFFVINSLISFHLGQLIKKANLRYWWLFLMPLIFCLAVWPHFALYNLVFGLVYLIIEVLGLMANNLYR